MVVETVICRAREHPFDAEVYRCFPVGAAQFHRPVADLPRRGFGAHRLHGRAGIRQAVRGQAWPVCSLRREAPARPHGRVPRRGREHASDLDILPSSPGVFGQLPSNATVSRFFERTVTNPELFGYGFETLTRELRTRAWDAAGNRNPALTATALGPLIIDVDATLVTSHSDKERVAGTYKGGYGAHRI